ncbi:MAG TPA: CehA/McbA family metallohydrolase [Opitutaceae bacterium]|nr:CehA/McbA family metallohydrolase [Opitutaceae bacterium]
MLSPLRTPGLATWLGVAAILAGGAGTVVIHAADLPPVHNLELQPLAAQVARLQDALEYLGAPLSATERAALTEASRMRDHPAAVDRIQEILDAHCLFGVTISPEMRLSVYRGPAAPELVEQGWRNFLVKVDNRAGIDAMLQVASPNAGRLHNASPEMIPSRWLEVGMFGGQPLHPNLSGFQLEYRVIQLYSRDAGRRSAQFAFSTPVGGQDQGGVRNELGVTFDVKPARPITLRVTDENGQPTVACFVIKDKLGHVYPSPAKRLAPDFAFHHQIYRGDGEVLKLPDGVYSVELSRGPESLPQTTTLMVNASTKSASFRSARWVDPSKAGWWSGDHHIHAAGCSHYEKPTEGVHADDMIRHTMGEDLKVGANLTWGPCFDYQKQFFCGAIDKVSKYPYLLRYDIEVSGFGSHQSGHLCLLRLKEQMFPGGNSMSHWPTLGLNTLRWAKKQGAVCGPAHSGWGLQPAIAGETTSAGSTNSGALRLATAALPNYVVPPFNGIGANEYIVDVTHEVPGPDGKLVPAVDFISTVNTPYVWELNIWYHTLNAGFRTRASGETDFPCVYDEKVGLGRSYVKLDGQLDYDAWCEGIRLGRNYVSDGKSHLMNFKANDVAMGEGGSELRLAQPGRVHLTARVAARLNEQPNPQVQLSSYEKKPYWDLERARISTTRQVPVEVVVNGVAVARKDILADGREQDVAFDIDVAQSSWVALRILPSSHTNPIFVLVGGKPIRASRRSVEWCLKSVDQCWSQKQRFIKPAELADAKAAYAHARETYRRLLSETTVD